MLMGLGFMGLGFMSQVHGMSGPVVGDRTGMPSKLRPPGVCHPEFGKWKLAETSPRASTWGHRLVTALALV